MRVRTSLADSYAASARRITNDLDYLAVKLHGRRSRMAEADRLDGLCRIQALPQFFYAILPEADVMRASDFQRQLTHELIREFAGLLAYMSGPGAVLISWILLRFQLENIKVLARLFVTKAPISDRERYLASLPEGLSIDFEGLAAAESLEDFIQLIPEKLLKDELLEALAVHGDYPQPFFFEAILDHAYFRGLIDRLELLPRQDREIVTPMILQEVDIFHLMLVLRGKYHYTLTSEMLLPMHVEGTKIPHPLFAQMLGDHDPHTSVGRTVGRVLDEVTFEQGPGDGHVKEEIDAATAERLAWQRFRRLANLAFRRSHIRLGAIIGYTGLRRVEVANLITISEGIEMGLPAETIRAHLILDMGRKESHA